MFVFIFIKLYILKITTCASINNINNKKNTFYLQAPFKTLQVTLKDMMKQQQSNKSMRIKKKTKITMHKIRVHKQLQTKD